MCVKSWMNAGMTAFLALLFPVNFGCLHAILTSHPMTMIEELPFDHFIYDEISAIATN